MSIRAATASSMSVVVAAPASVLLCSKFLHQRSQESLDEQVEGLRNREALERRAGDLGVACCASGASCR